MVSLQCQNKEIESKLAAMCDVLLEHGAFFHENLIIVEEDGNFSLRASVAGDPIEPAVIIPKSCMIRFKDIRLDVSGNDLFISWFNPDLTKHQHFIIQTAVDIYNLSGKFLRHKAGACSSLLYDYPDLFKNFAAFLNYEEMIKLSEKGKDRHLVNDFFLLRTMKAYDFREKVPNDLDSVPKSNFFIPIIEYVNHRILAPAVSVSGNEGKYFLSMFLMFYSEEPSNEIFASYNYYDLRECFFLEGFIAQDCYFVRSIPFKAKLANGVLLKVLNFMDRPGSYGLPPDMQDLKQYAPVIKKDEQQKIVTLNYLLIPGEDAPRAMRRILRYVLENYCDLDPKDVSFNQSKLLVESGVIKSNLTFYMNMLDFIKKYEVEEFYTPLQRSMIEVVELQIQKIKKYPFYEQAMKDT